MAFAPDYATSGRFYVYYNNSTECNAPGGANCDIRVDEFHRAMVAAGYRDNGPPGERRYHPGYYGAFVLDPDGNNVEAVCHNRA